MSSASVCVGRVRAIMRSQGARASAINKGYKNGIVVEGV